jgi:MFS family permease
MPRGVKVNRFHLHKSVVSVLFMLVNAFLWFYLISNVLIDFSEEYELNRMVLFSLHSFGAIIGEVAALPLSKFHYKTLIFWTLLGAFASLLPLLHLSSLYIQIICFIWGFSFGLGLPLCLSYFARKTTFENRGRLSGAIFLLSFFGTSLFVNLSYMLKTSPLLFLFLCLWRLSGILPLVFIMGEQKIFKKNVVTSKGPPAMYTGVLYLYFTPWLIFNIVDGLEGTLLRDFVKAAFPGHYATLQTLYSILLAIWAILGGFLCDLIGRKPSTILGFTAMGIAYAIISMVPKVLFAWFFFYICDSVSWGLLITIFIPLIWGDLSRKDLEEKCYLIGTIPFFLSAIVQNFFADYMKFLSEANAFSLAALFLFLAIVPLLFAPETLPERVLKERDLRSYIERAKRVREKFTKG